MENLKPPDPTDFSLDMWARGCTLVPFAANGVVPGSRGRIHNVCFTVFYRQHSPAVALAVQGPWASRLLSVGPIVTHSQQQRERLGQAACPTLDSLFSVLK